MFTGLPRNDASLSEPEYLSVTDLNDKYMETLVTPAIPGVAIAVLLFLVCFLVVFLRVCTKCCAMCCPGSCWDRNCFRPQEYNDRKLKITKWAMLIFCIIGGIGCMLVFSQGTELSKGVGDLPDERRTRHSRLRTSSTNGMTRSKKYNRACRRTISPN